MVRNHKIRALVLAFVMATSVVTMSGVGAGVQAATNQGDGEQPAAEAAGNVGDADDVDGQDGEEDAEPRPDQLPPGVSEADLNLTELYEAHQRVLRDEGYEATENVTVRVNGSTYLTATVVSAATSDGEESSVDATVTVAGEEHARSVWRNETVTAVRTVQNGDAEYVGIERGQPALDGANRSDTDAVEDDVAESESGAGVDVPAATGDGYQAAMSHHGTYAGADSGVAVPGHVLVGFDDAVRNVTVEEAPEGTNASDGEDGQDRWTITATLDFQESNGQFTGELTMTVDDRGVIHAADLSTLDDYGVETTYTLSLDEPGVDELERPGWVAEVPDEDIVSPPERAPVPEEPEPPGQTPEGPVEPAPPEEPEPGPGDGPGIGPGPNEGPGPGDSGPGAPGHGGGPPGN